MLFVVLFSLACVDGTPSAGTDACSSYQGLATREEIASTPRAHTQLEALAIQVDGTFIATQATYDRVVADVEAARGTYPRLAGIKTSYGGYGQNVTVYHTDTETLDAIMDGSFEPTVCADRLYVRTGAWRSIGDMVSLEFKGIYDQDALAAEYARLTGASAEPDAGDGDGDQLCVQIDGETWQYRFEDGWGDCASGCIAEHWYWVTSKSSGASLLMDDWGDINLGNGKTGVDPDPEPDWMSGDWICFP